MLNARVELRGDELYCTDVTGVGGAAVRRLTAPVLARLQDWACRYDRAVTSRQADALPAIGRDIADLLNEGDAWLDRSLQGTGEIAFEIIVAGTADEVGRALLDAPWELLAPGGVFLAGDPQRLYRVDRRLGAAAKPRPPTHRDLSLVFMAADVEGESPLNYEHEELAILDATRRLDINLIVEESGCLEFLDPCLAEERPEALHISCHGTIDARGPVLALETAAGRLALTTVADLRTALGEEGQRPALVFLSACRTAEHGAAAASFTQALVRTGIDSAVGWDGSVYDSDAIGFANVFYKQLAAGRSVAYAVAQARHALLRQHMADPAQGRHWHLARLCLGPAGGGPLCAAGKPKRVFRKGAGFKEFLDKANARVPVATAAEFVGRRRQAQRVLRAFRDREAAGVLIHGMGNLGKSSLAARVANRLPHHETVVLYERYHALAVFEALLKALPPRLAPDADQAWRAAISRDEETLKGALQELLEGPFRCEDAGAGLRPILLIVDDLEQILEPPRPGEAATPVRAAYSTVLAAIIAAFRDADSTDSRLLLTSRYTFTLTDGRGDDLCARLLAVPLPPMDDVQRDKQIRAAALLAGPTGAGTAATDAACRAALERRIKAAASGNPGLQEILARPLLAGETEAAEKAVVAVEGYLASGAIPAEPGAAITFFERVSLQTYRAMLAPAEEKQLQAATLFSLPVPRPALGAAGIAAGVARPARALDRLAGLGLIDLYVLAEQSIEAAINALARPLVEALSAADQARLATAVIAPLYAGWKDGSGGLPCDPRGLEVARLALLGDADAAILNAAALAGGGFLFDRGHDAKAAFDLVSAAVAALDRQAATPDLHLLRLGAECAERLGDVASQEALLTRGLASAGGEPWARASLLSAHASRLITKGELGAAETALGQAAETFRELGDVHSRAVSMGQIADILQARGQLDEALRILKEEELPVYERLGDVRSRAMTMGKIADILVRRGQLDEALRILKEEVLPACERLGDVRGLLVGRTTLGQILLVRTANNDRPEARQLLCLALADARRLRLPEAQQIEAILAHVGLSCD